MKLRHIRKRKQYAITLEMDHLRKYVFTFGFGCTSLDDVSGLWFGSRRGAA